jgi:hypothetical protein
MSDDEKAIVTVDPVEMERPEFDATVVGSTQKAWAGMVLDAHQWRCANCGGTDRIRVHMVVPESAGGKLVPSNGTVLCRTCEFARDAVVRHSEPLQQRPINFWVSRPLHSRIHEHIRPRNGTNSLGSLVRYLIQKFIADPDRFDDLERYQDTGKKDVKINVWVNADDYVKFKLLLDQRRMTVTDAVKALLQVYDEETIILSVTGKEPERTKIEEDSQ